MLDYNVKRGLIVSIACLCMGLSTNATRKQNICLGSINYAEETPLTHSYAQKEGWGMNCWLKPRLPASQQWLQSIRFLAYSTIMQMLPCDSLNAQQLDPSWGGACAMIK
jgi:hypothetical protein